MRSIRIKGVTIQAIMTGNHGCCGARSIQDFRVEGNDAKLTPEEQQYLYVDLYRKLRGESKHLWSSVDAIPDTNGTGWSAGTGSSNRGKAMSLAGFCEATGFIQVGTARNPNNSHVLTMYMDAYINTKGKTRAMPEYPKITIEEPVVSTDITLMADAIIAELQR